MDHIIKFPSNNTKCSGALFNLRSDIVHTTSSYWPAFQPAPICFQSHKYLPHWYFPPIRPSMKITCLSYFLVKSGLYIFAKNKTRRPSSFAIRIFESVTSVQKTPQIISSKRVPGFPIRFYIYFTIAAETQLPGCFDITASVSDGRIRQSGGHFSA